MVLQDFLSLGNVGTEPWMVAFSEAVARKMAIGKDIVFTVGPLAGLFSKVYHPGTETLIVVAGLLLAAAVIASLKYHWSLILLFTLGIFSREGLLGSIPFIIGLAQVKPRRIWTMAALGLLPLIKGSYWLSSVAVTGWITGWLVIHGRYKSAVAGIVLVIMTNLGFWWASGQPLMGIVDYYASMAPMISGFAAGMAIYSRSWEVLLYILVATAIMWAIFRQKTITLPVRIYVLGLMGLHLFTNFKAGFVRHDIHTLNATTGLLICISLLTIRFRPDFKQILVGTVLAALLITEKQVPSLIGYINPFYRSTPSSEETPIDLPLLPGTSDIYSVDQTALLLSGNSWQPRPVFQSYAAYAPSLLQMNKQHLLTNPPENIFFRVEPIDWRLPALEEGVSWPVLLTNYDLTSATKTHLILKHQENIDPILMYLSDVTAKLGETVVVPEFRGKLFVKLEIKPTLVGKLVTFLFKPQELRIEAKLTDGRTVNYRMIPAMAKAGFVLSPLVEDTADFASLINGTNSKLVKSFSISPAASYNYSWKLEYRVEFFEL